MEGGTQKDVDKLIKQVNALLWGVGGILAVVVLMVLLIFVGDDMAQEDADTSTNRALIDSAAPVNHPSLDESNDLWTAADLSQAPKAMQSQLEYGKDLIVNTAKYLGPKGSVAHLTNGMNCQNCHLNAGTQPYGNNYGSVASTYPKYRGRSGAIEDIYKRVADCFERSLNGTAPKVGSKEMEAIVAYINYVGSNVKKGDKAKGSGIYELALLDRAADPVKGKELYDAKCVSCHQADGSGMMNADKIAYQYPPLWGDHSYNHGAGLYRLSRFAGYIKANMPLGASYKAPMLSDEEAWDLAAYVNSMPRPSKDLSKDWPKLEEKNFDHPFGPFADAFSEAQHKFGPFKPIKEAQKKAKKG
ncbi:MAG: c-type cytochrome [Bacteroidia bacterium]|nr:c-type cytochrome [Bacteroidia bacterium]